MQVLKGVISKMVHVLFSESTSISSVIRRLLHGGKNWRSLDLEDQSWYTDPIDFLWPRSPSQRLYKRQASLPEVRGCSSVRNDLITEAK